MNMVILNNIIRNNSKTALFYLMFWEINIVFVLLYVIKLMRNRTGFIRTIKVN